LEDTGFVPPDLPLGGRTAVRIEVHGIDAVLDELTAKVGSPPPVEHRGDSIEIRLVDPDGWDVVVWQRV
jgi:hypothetical protein